uniref:Secreted protein n=1 Tax=Steinernema glaseri TaxID=37863 RepID=A0A1I8AC81_9BILA
MQSYICLILFCHKATECQLTGKQSEITVNVAGIMCLQRRTGTDIKGDRSVVRVSSAMESFLLRLFLFALVISLIQGAPVLFSDYWSSFYGYTPGGDPSATDYPTGDPYGATGGYGGYTPGGDPSATGYTPFAGSLYSDGNGQTPPGGDPSATDYPTPSYFGYTPY